MDIIKQEHKHELVLQWVDGKLVYKCLHHECEYVEDRLVNNDGSDMR